MDFLGQIYTFLYYSVPKSQGFELSYSLINDNKLKILFQKTNCPEKGWYRHKKLRKNSLFILCEDKFKATSTVKTSEMTQEILHKLSEALGIKLKIMEYEDRNENKYLTIIIPYIIDNENDLLDFDIDETQLDNNFENKKLRNSDKQNIKRHDKNNFEIEDESKKKKEIIKNIKTNNSDKNNLKPTLKSNSLNLKFTKNNNNNNIFKNNNQNLNSNNKINTESFLIEQVDEKTSEDDISSDKDNLKVKERENNNNNLNSSKPYANINISYSTISKSSLNIPGTSVLSSQKYSLYKSKTPMSDKHYGIQINNFKDFSTNYLNEVNPSLIQNDNNASKDIIYKNMHKKNPLSLIHQKYSNLERLKRRGVEILTEEENKNENNNSFIYLDSINPEDNNTSLRDKNSIDVEADSDNFIEFENEDEVIDDESFSTKKNEINSSNRNKSHNKSNHSLLNLNYVHNNNKLVPENELSSQIALKNKSLFGSNRRSNKTINYQKTSNDSLFVIPEINESFLTKVQKKNNQITSNCNCKDILLVDDDEFILKTSKNILKSFKLEADFAENGQECINKIKAKQEKNCNCPKSKYKLILMDITMPIMDGIEAAKNIQKMIDQNQLYDTIKIVFISAHANLDLTAILSGIKCAIDYYPKPISGVKYKSLLEKYYFSK